MSVLDERGIVSERTTETVIIGRVIINVQFRVIVDHEFP